MFHNQSGIFSMHQVPSGFQPDFETLQYVWTIGITFHLHGLTEELVKEVKT